MFFTKCTLGRTGRACVKGVMSYKEDKNSPFCPLCVANSLHKPTHRESTERHTRQLVAYISPVFASPPRLLEPWKHGSDATRCRLSHTLACLRLGGLRTLLQKRPSNASKASQAL